MISDDDDIAAAIDGDRIRAGRSTLCVPTPPRSPRTDRSSPAPGSSAMTCGPTSSTDWRPASRSPERGLGGRSLRWSDLGRERPAEADEGAVGSGDALRHVMGTFLSGVTVVSTVWQDVAHAMTATAFSAVSLDPPLVLVCVSKHSRFHAAVLGAGRWAVSLLRRPEPIARHFSNRGWTGRPNSTTWSTTAPRLRRSTDRRSARLAGLDTYATYDGGDHTIVLGELSAPVEKRRPDARWRPIGARTLTR